MSPNFLRKWRIENGHGAIGADAVTLVVGGVMRESTEGKGVLVDILRVAEHGHNEIAAANVMSEITEKMAAVRIVAEVLYDGATIGIGLRGTQFFFGGVGIFCLEQWFQMRLPYGVNQRLMGENGIGIARRGGQEFEEEKERKSGSTGAKSERRYLCG